MTTPHTETGDQDLREHIINKWTHVAVFNANGDELLRDKLSTSDRVSLESDATQNPIEYQIVVSGEDTEINPPVSLNAAELFKSADATNAVSGDVFETPADINEAADIVNITLAIEQPVINDGV
jgi:hypothetical protein